MENNNSKSSDISEVQQQQQQQQMQQQSAVPALTQIITADTQNELCVTCNTKSTHASINNGITLCTACANIHKEKLTYDVSYIRALDERWDTYLISFLLKGGNTKFKQALSELPSNSQSPDQLVLTYHSKAIDYYRRNLKANVMKLGKIEKDYTNASDDAGKENIFPEFETYTVAEGNDGVVGNLKQIGRTIVSNAKDLSSGFGKKVVEVGAETGKKLQQAKTFIVGGAGSVKNRIVKLVTSIKTGVVGQGNKKKEEDGGVMQETPGVQIDVDLPVEQQQQQQQEGDNVKEEEQKKKEEEEVKDVKKENEQEQKPTSSNEHDDMVDMLLENINNQ